MDASHSTSRRALLAGVASALVGVAGCLRLDESAGQAGNATSGNGTATASEPPTTTPVDAPTPTPEDTPTPTAGETRTPTPTSTPDQDIVTLTVTIVDTAGDPVGDALLTVYADGDDIATVGTASNGMAFVDVPAGAEVSVEVSDEDYSRTTPPDPPRTITEDTKLTIEVELE